MRFLAILAGVLGVAALVVGCGGGGDVSTLSSAEFKKQANGICKELLTEAEAEMAAWSSSKGKNAEGVKTNAEGETADEIMGTYYETKLKQLNELAPPEADQDRFAAMLSALEDGIEEGEETPEVFISGSETMEEVGRISGELGLECGV